MGEAAVEMRKPRVLVIEDDFLIASAAAEFLQELGVDVVAAYGTLRQALEVISSVECDAAILDIVLHSEDSFPVAETLRQRGIPFGFATAWDKLALDEKWREVPRISKPYNRDDLAGLLKQILPDRSPPPEPLSPIGDTLLPGSQSPPGSNP